MPLVTLTRVADDHRTFETQNGSFAAFKVWAGDDVGEVVTKADTLDKRLAQFREIVGKPTELVVEDQGNFSDGNPKPKKIKFPQQGQGGGGGKGSYVPRWTDTEAGAKWADDRIDRRRALELAVTFVGDGMTVGAANTREVAESFYRFLQSADIEPVPSGSYAGSPGDGKVDADGSGVESTTQGGGTSDPTSPEQEQMEAYIQVLRDGPGNTQSVLQARALFESDARKVRNLRDLTVDELLKVVQAFKDKVPA